MSSRTTTVLFLLLAMIPAVLNAQDYRGQIIGKILDPSGAAIPGASARIRFPRLRHPLSMSRAAISFSPTRRPGFGMRTATTFSLAPVSPIAC